MLNYGIVIFVNLINVLLSILKDMAMAAYLGTSKEADAFFTAFFIPDMIGNNLVAVALGVAAIPILGGTLEKYGMIQLPSRLKSMIHISTKISLILMLAILLGAGLLLDVLGNGFDEGTRQMALLVLYVLTPAMIIYPLITLRMSLLQVVGAYGKSVLGSVILNAVILGGVLTLSGAEIHRNTGIVGLALVIDGALLLEILYLSMCARKTVKREADKEEFVKDPIEKEFLSKFYPYLLMLLLTQIIVYYERYLGSSMAEGSVAAISYTNRLSQFPIFVFGYSIALIAMPEISKHVESSQMEQTRKIYSGALRHCGVLSSARAIGLSVLREPIITILFKRNSFNQESVILCAAVLMGYGLAVVGQGITLLNIRVLVALGNMKAAIMGMAVLIGINIGLDTVLAKYFGISGIGYGAFIGSTLIAMMLTFIILNKLKMKVAEEVLFVIKTLGANGGTLIAAVGLKGIWNGYFIIQPIGNQFAFGLLSGVFICGISYFSIKVLKII